jgi:ribonuclease E
MTENDQNEKVEKVVPVRKAKTGAWWKSVPQAVAEAPAVPAEPLATGVPVKAEEGASEDSASPPSSSRKPLREKVQATAPPADELPVEAAPAAQEEGPVIADGVTTDPAEEPGPLKKRRSRRGGKKRAKPTEVPLSTEEVPTDGVADPQGDDEAAQGNEGPVVENGVAADSAEEPIPPKKRRSRRGGKKRSKQPETPQTQEEGGGQLPQNYFLIRRMTTMTTRWSTIRRMSRARR